MRKRERDGDGIRGSFGELLKLMGWSVRLDILGALAGGPRNVTELADQVDVGIKVTSNHLRRLAQRGLLAMHGDHRAHIYEVSRSITAVRTESGEHFFLATRDGGWALLRLPDARAGRGLRRPTLEEMRRIAEIIAARDEPNIAEPSA